jgi:deoxyribonuclease V
VLACVDVHYHADGAVAVCVEFVDWTDARPRRESCARILDPAPYSPGEFYRRELPCLLAVLKTVRTMPAVIVIDGYVWLDRDGRRGLGAHLHEALGGSVPIVGIAKAAFASGDHAIHVRRGASQRPLYVTAVGMEVEVAADHVRAMHGAHRIPTLIARCDRLSRGA